jgi:integrase
MAGHREAKLAKLARKAETLARASKAPSTIKAYNSDWADFEAWCRGHRLRSLPAVPETVAMYIAELADDCAAGTISRRLISISRRHRTAGLSSPATAKNEVVGEALKGVRRLKGTAQKGKDPLLLEHIRKVIKKCPDGLLGIRDKALLLVGFAGAFRRSELVALECQDLKFTRNGAIATIRVSKTDQERAGAQIALFYGKEASTCPVTALRHWLRASNIKSGPAFRGVDRHQRVSRNGLNADSVARIVKRALLRAGYSPKNFAGHSLRAGFATQASLNGSTEIAIQRQTRHKSLVTLRKYIRPGEIFRLNAASDLGL